jgi:L-ascorbate metabolism protein UlaG (beta-lactamase superfamily)
VNKFRSPGVPFHPLESGYAGFVLTVAGVRIYHAGDTDQIPEMQSLRVDVALLPVGGHYTMTAIEAVQAAAVIRPQIAVPMHMGAIVGSRADAEYFRDQANCAVEILPLENQ